MNPKNLLDGRRRSILVPNKHPTLVHNLFLPHESSCDVKELTRTKVKNVKCKQMRFLENEMPILVRYHIYFYLFKKNTSIFTLGKNPKSQGVMCF